MDNRAKVESITKLFTEHEFAIRALINRHARCRHDVEDLYQNLYLYLIHRPPRHQKNILAYLSKAIRHHATDVTRHAISHCGCIARYAVLQRDHVLDKEPEDILVQVEQIHKIMDAIESALPAHIAQTIFERYLHNRTIQETAAQLGVNERTVSHYCCTGLRKIRELIQEGKIQIDRCDGALLPVTPPPSESAA